MKQNSPSIVFIFIIVCCQGTFGASVAVPSQGTVDAEPQDALGDLLKGIFELIRLGLIEANADPFPVPEIFLNISEPALRGKLQLKETKIAGVAGFNVTKVAANIITLKVELGISFPILEISGDYDIDAVVLGIVPIYGKGPFSIKIENIDAGGGGKLKLLTGGYLSIADLIYNLALGNLTVKFDGLLGGELGDFIIDIINDLGLEIFNRIEGAAHDLIVSTLTSIINSVIGQWTLADIISGNIGKTTTTTTIQPVALKTLPRNPYT